MARRSAVSKTSGRTFRVRVGIVFDSVWLATRADGPHGVRRTRGAKTNQLDRHARVIERLFARYKQFKLRWYTEELPFNNYSTVHCTHGWVRAPSRSIPPPWRSIRSRLAPRTHDAPPMWALSACGEPDEIKTNTRPECLTL